MKIAHISTAMWVANIIENRDKVSILDDEGVLRKYDTRGVMGNDVETAIVRFSDNFVEREIPFVEVIEMRLRGKIYMHL